MSLREVSTRSQALVDSLRSTFQQIAKLSKEPNPELSQDIHETLKQHEEALELLQQDVEDFAGFSDRIGGRDTERTREIGRLTAQVARLSEDLRHARSQYRRAQLSAKRALEASKQADRESQFVALKQAYSSDKPTGTTADLFAGRRSQNKQLTEDELLINTSSDITSALRQTHDRLTSELSRSRFAQETLAQSTAALSDLGERYTSLDTLLANSKALLGTLVKSQKSDTWYLETAFYILVATLCWLVFRRLIYGPAWWFVWLPFKFFLIQPFAFLIRAFGGSPEGVKALQSSSSRPPLRVQPSASGGPPKIPAGLRPSQRVGAGGAGAKLGKQGESRQEESFAEKIGRMAEESRQQASGADGQRTTEGSDQSQEYMTTGDGRVLQERGDIPPNPKKKVFDVDVEDAKYEEQQRQLKLEEKARIRDEL
ncbi:hypothetical protein K461DRAFT_310422 [Myriangium duriaei CBS 260.36]|uniref:Sec20 C-terminal domain-containing protein n=1 Tax=Myriangium duriaei CBS 260.36 TaxID=1168546 RepID=A0A9P4J9W4_9PEZI|nr:hypothetical protein K461DRAFT_310422 [Myriangium duriaei CBS 260.36]